MRQGTVLSVAKSCDRENRPLSHMMIYNLHEVKGV